MALTGSESGIAAEAPADPLEVDDMDSSDDEGGAPGLEVEPDEALISANEIAGKDFPLAHRLLDQRGFQNFARAPRGLLAPAEG